MCIDRREAGTASLELALSLFFIIFAMVFLLGLGHTLINKQQSLVAARFAAFQHAGSGRAPAAATVGRAVASPETWSLSAGFTNDSNAGQAGGGLVGAGFSTLLGQLGRSGSVTYTASTTPTRGLLPRMATFRASSKYTLAVNPWSCAGGGSYLSILLSNVGLGGLPLDLSCCKTYTSR